jgi:dTDP-4-dehydrorhamnose 3,5-epimerase-like enzyme
MEVKMIDFEIRGDKRGSLVAIEEKREVPFEIKRVYYLFGTRPGVRRGYHAHRSLQQVLVALSGSCKIFLDDGKEQRIVELNKPYRGLYIGKFIWREMFQFSEDCVLMVLADEYYDEGDYIRDYQEFQRVIDDVNS